MRLKTRRARLFDRRRMPRESERQQREMQSESLALLDDLLGRFAVRRVVSSSEVIDLLLDVRSAIVFEAAVVALGIERQDE